MRARALRPLVYLFLGALLIGCPEQTPQRIELDPPETFTWTTGQPITFSPPPTTWRRSRYQNGGAEGVDFVLSGSKGEQIFVAERFFLGKRDHCERLKILLETFEGLDRHGFSSALQRARPRRDSFLNETEEQAAYRVNRHLDDAREAYGRDDFFVARRELTFAVEQATTVRYTLEETVDQVLFTAKGNRVYPDLWVGDPFNGEVDGRQAQIVQFTFNGHGLPMLGRRIYVVANNRLFEFGFQGLEEHLDLFERLLASVSFPAGVCEH